jgi:hypothetical protein
LSARNVFGMQSLFAFQNIAAYGWTTQFLVSRSRRTSSMFHNPRDFGPKGTYGAYPVTEAFNPLGSFGTFLLATTLLLLGSIFESRAEATSARQASTRQERFAAGFFFTASPRQAGFPVPVGDGRIDVIIVDLKSGDRKRLSSADSSLLTPFLSEDGERLLLVRFKRTGIYELLSCTTTILVCRVETSGESSINSPVEVGVDKILYVGSPIRTIPGVRSRYPQHDLWILERGGLPRQLTQLQFFEMNWLSVAGANVYFSAMGSSSGRDVIPKFEPVAMNYSDIFRLPFDAVHGTAQAPDRQLIPLFVSGGRSTAASVAPDESIAAFLETRNQIGGYRYDVTVVDSKSGGSKSIESTGRGFSRPAVVNGAVLVREIFDDRYVVGRVTPGNSKMEPLVEITDASIAATEITEIKVEEVGQRP